MSSSPTKRRLHALLVSLPLVLASSGALADDKEPPKCDAETEFASEDWFLSKVRCGVDELLDTGKDILGDLALDLLGSAIDSYIPGLSSLLFGGGQDPMAAYVQKILDAIGDAEHNVISAILSNEKDNTLKVDFNAIRSQLATLGTVESLANKLGRFQGGYYANLEDTMDHVRQALQNREDVFGLDALHTLITLSALHVEVKPEVNYLAELTGRGLYADDVEELSDEERADIQAAVASDTDRDVRGVLIDSYGVLPYLEGVARNNKYRAYSDAAFGERDQSCLKWFLSVEYVGATCNVAYDVQDGRTIWNSQKEVGTREIVKNRQLIRLTCEEVHVPQNDFERTQCTQVKFSMELPDHTQIVRHRAYATCPAGQSCGWLMDDGVIRELYQIHKDWAYRQALLTAYGPIRATIDEWYRTVGQSPPAFAVDTDLEDAVLKPTCALIDLGDQTQPCTGGVQAKLATLLASTRDQAPLSKLDRRRVVNYVMQYGSAALDQLRTSAKSFDPLSAPAPWSSAYLDVVREHAAPRDYERIFKSAFAAKFSVLR